jgi:hypothetical protein
MKKTFTIALFAIISICLNIPCLFGQEKVELFNGNDLKGWHAYSKSTGSVADAGKVFTVKDHMLVLSGPENGYIMTNDTFKNFKIIAEYRWELNVPEDQMKRTKNSGIMYNIPASLRDTLWPKGILCDVRVGLTGDFFLLNGATLTVKDSISKPAKAVVFPMFFEAEKPAGEWNTVEITSLNGKCTSIVNGQLVNEGINGSPTSGRILIQYERYPILFRKFELIKLTN